MLSYDFDIFFADKAQATQGARAAKGLTAQGQSRSDTVIALFRHQETADAVTAAPSVVRLFLEETGFGFSTSNDGVPSGYARADDAETRRGLVDQLTETLSNRALKKALIRAADESEFDISAFVATVTSSEPIKVDITPPKATVVPRRPHELRCKGIKSRMRPH